MNILSVENLSRTYGERVLFEGLGFGISQGDKIALVANNGTGKSSLLNILAGLEPPETGEVVTRNGIRVSFLPQEPNLPANMTIQEVTTDHRQDIQEAQQNYENATHGNGNLEEATAEMDRLDAWDYERRLMELLSRFNLTQLDQECGSLSGGQQKRVALALTLLDDPDLLLLDEPTNHLDVDMVEWLEKELARKNLTLFMVTHDRYFLDGVCNQILELTDGELFTHPGDYATFLTNRAERRERERIEIEKAGKLMKTELDWIRRMPKARGTKSKARIQQFYQTKEKALSGKKEEEIQLSVKTTRLGGKIMELKKVRKSFGDLKILDGFSYTFKKGERIGIVGANGVGKSTLLRIITGEEKADSGKIDRGETLVMSHYRQDGGNFDPDKKVIDVLRDFADVIELANGVKLTASQFLNHFLFPPKMQQNKVGLLSGGEKRRLYLMTVLMKNPNFLILDEPTNDLDLLTLNKLEDFLLEFGGCLMVVSHDRYFMDTLADHLFVLEGDGVIRDFYGNYTEYREDKEQRAQEKEVEVKEEPVRVQNRERKLSYKEKLELETLEKELEQLEARKLELEKAMNEADATDYEKLQQVGEEMESIIREVDLKTDRWIVLSDLV